eukprot:5558569-Prymnesium_polylepis.1
MLCLASLSLGGALVPYRMARSGDGCLTRAASARQRSSSRRPSMCPPTASAPARPRCAHAETQRAEAALGRQRTVVPPLCRLARSVP